MDFQKLAFGAGNTGAPDRMDAISTPSVNQPLADLSPPQDFFQRSTGAQATAPQPEAAPASGAETTTPGTSPAGPQPDPLLQHFSDAAQNEAGPSYLQEVTKALSTPPSQ